MTPRASRTGGTSDSEIVLSAVCAFTAATKSNTSPSALQVLKSSSMARMNASFASFVRFISSRVSSGEGMSWAFCSCQSRFFTAFSIRHSAAPASASRSSEKSSGLR